MNRIEKYRSRCLRWFDRSFSGGWGRQVIFLGGALLVFLFLGTAALYIFADLPVEERNPRALIRALELLLDPGSFNGSSNDFPILLQLIITLIGAVVFTSMLITVLGNIISNRIEDYKRGRVRYSSDDHVLILGANSMLVNMLREFISTGVHQNRKIVVLTTQDTERLHDKIMSDIPEIEEKLDVIWLNGSRVIEKTLRNVQVDDAYSIYILGEDDEIDHDSINLECWRIVKIICKDVCRPVQCYLVVDRVSTYHVLQFGKKEKDTWLYLNVINSLENWAQRVLVSREYTTDFIQPDKKQTCKYPAIDRNGIGRDSDKTVRYVIYGMTQMGYAMASTVAHIAHFPNFKDGKNRTKICFVAPDIREEMDFFLGHYDNIFRLSHADYVYWDKSGNLIREKLRAPLEDYGDFLDIEWEFIDGSIESDKIRSLLNDWACNEREYLSLVLCENESDVNVAASLYLPESIYAKSIPVFVYQPLRGEVLKYAHGTCRYRNVYPFGMKEECYDPLFRRRIVKAKRINFLYHLENNGNKYEAMATPDVLEEYWNTQLEYVYKLSNLYAANSIPVKLRSVGMDPDSLDEKSSLSQYDIAVLSEVEHNRWNMERLLLGMQPVRTARRQEINAMLDDTDEEVVKRAKAIVKHLKDNFYHKDIAPYDELLASSKQYDTAIVANILDVIREV